MPTADQLFYGSLRASTPIRRGVPSTTTASREDSRRRATTPTATSSEARRVSSLRAHEGPRVVKSTNVTTSAAVSSSQKDNRFSGAAQDQGPQQRARVDMQQRSTPSFSSSHITGHSLDSAAVVDERRHSHRWAKASTTTSGGTPLMSSLSTVRRHPAHSPTRTARTVNGEGMTYDGIDDGAPKLFALEKTLEAEMMELRRLTDSLETTMASVMSLEDQRKTLARMVGRSRTLQTQREAPQQQQQQQHQYTNGERRSDQDAMIATPRRAVAPVPISPRQFHEQQLPPSHAVSSEPRTFNWATPSSQHQQRRQQRGDNLTSEVDDESQVLSFVASAIQLTDSGKKKAATTLQVSSPKQMTASSSRRAPRQADVSLADDYDDLLALESSPIVSHVNERIVMRQPSNSSQKKDYHHTPHKVVRDDDDDDDKETVEERLSDDDNDAMMVIDFSSSSSPMKKSQRGNHNERRNERDIDTAHTSSSHRRASFVQPNMESANQQGVKTSHHNFSPPQSSSNRDTASSSTLPDPSVIVPTSFSSAALLLGAQAHSLKGDLLKYEEDLLMLQDELIRTQRGGGGDDESEMALLMHLRLVLRDELSTCKKRGQTLESVAEQLILAR